MQVPAAAGRATSSSSVSSAGTNRTSRLSCGSPQLTAVCPPPPEATPEAAKAEAGSDAVLVRTAENPSLRVTPINSQRPLHSSEDRMLPALEYASSTVSSVSSVDSSPRHHHGVYDDVHATMAMGGPGAPAGHGFGVTWTGSAAFRSVSGWQASSCGIGTVGREHCLPALAWVIKRQV